ncbi:MAG: tetratricopeptide repeat protein [Gemmataceae bacterium]|nr:tetratricopeptide repeat protein [Gemmataceae bacterium]
MDRAWVGRRLWAVVVGVGLAAGAGRADDPPAAKADAGDDGLKAELLKLNRATGPEDQFKALRGLVKDKAKAKKAVALGLKLQQAAGGKDKPFNFTGAYVLGRAAHYLRDYKAAEFFLTDCLDAATRTENGPKLVQAYRALFDLRSDQKRFADVVDLAEKFVDLRGPEEVDRFKPFALERMIQAKARLGKTDEALKAAEGLVQLDDGGWYFLRLKGFVLREAGKHPEAVEAYLESLDKLDAAKALEPEVREDQKDLTRYILSGLYVDAGEVDKAARQLQALIKKDADNPTYKNDLGFIWADHDKNLDESEKLIREALELDKKAKEKAKAAGNLDEVDESAAYLDSLGWVLFKKKKYDDALPYLKKAAADVDDGNHLEIWDHLGDCLLAMDKKDEAVEAWQKGLTMEDLGRRDIERRKKVEAKVKAAGAEPKKPAAPQTGTEPKKKDGE